MTGTEWNVESVYRVTDGDTLRVVRSRIDLLGNDEFIITDADPRGVPIRLVWVDTPERKAGSLTEWGRARNDLAFWVHDIPRANNFLRVVCYESAGWDRILGDLLDADGNSASQWLMTERGWPPYVRSAR